MNAKRLLAILLVLAMCIGVFAGCNQETPKETTDGGKNNETTAPSKPNATEPPAAELEPVVLRWFLIDGEKEGSKDVEEAFNAKLAEALPNTTVEFVFVDDYKTNWPLLLAGEEKMDLAWAGSATNFLQDSMDGNLIGLKELIAQYAPNIQSEIETWPGSWDTAKLDGEYYGIPNIQPIVAESQRFHIGEEFMKYMDVDAFVAELKNSEKLTAKLLDIIEDGFEAAIASGNFNVGDTSWNCMHSVVVGLMGYMPIGQQANNFWYDPLDSTPEPLYIWEIPEVKMAMERYGQWCDKGWITETLMLRQIPEGARHTVSFIQGWNSLPPEKDEKGICFVDGSANNSASYYMVQSNEPSEAFRGTVVYGGNNTYTTIPYTSENPERAMMLLNLIHSEEGVGYELANMLCYGFEENSAEAKKYGWFNYTAKDVDGEETVDQSTRGEAPAMHWLYNWRMTNTYKTMADGGVNTTKARKEYSMDFYENVYPALRATALDGMVVDYSGVSSELAAIQSVYTEYLDRFEFGAGGSANVEAVYAEAMAKLKEAGLDAVKAALQSQIDAYVG